MINVPSSSNVTALYLRFEENGITSIGVSTVLVSKYLINASLVGFVYLKEDIIDPTISLIV